MTSDGQVGGAWTLEEAVALCRQIEAVCPEFGCHVALTGGTLYKDGARKDCDLLFYRIRQVPEIDKAGLFNALLALGIENAGGFGWCHKATYNGKPLDVFFPEEDGGEYVESEGLIDLFEGLSDDEASALANEMLGRAA